MWIETVLDSLIDFISIIIGLSIAIIGVLTKTTLDEKRWPKNITVFGWTLVVLALLNFTFTWYKDFQKARKQEEVRYWVLLEVEQAICDLNTPYFLNSDPPMEEDRFALSLYLTNQDIALGVCKTDLLEQVGNDYQYWELGDAEETWGEVFTKHTERSCEKLKLILSNYSGILNTETIALIGQLTIHPWVEFIRDSEKRQVKNIARKPEIDKLILGSNKDKLQQRYVKLALDFGQKLELLERNIKEQHEDLYKRLDRDDPLPLFYRHYSGLIYLPELKYDE